MESDKICVLEKGRLVEEGSPEVFSIFPPHIDSLLLSKKETMSNYDCFLLVVL